MGSASIHRRRPPRSPVISLAASGRCWRIGRALNGARGDDDYGRAVDGIVAAAHWLMEKDVAKQAGNNHPTSIPIGVFKTSDGYINIATTGGRIRERRAQAIGAPDLVAIPDYAAAPAHSKNRDALNAEINKRKPSWFNELHAAGVPCGPTYSIDQIFVDAPGQASRHRPGCAEREEPSHPPGRPTGHGREPRAGWRRHRQSSANRRKKYLASLDLVRTRSTHWSSARQCNAAVEPSRFPIDQE
jgi:hypothetical protein